MLRSSRRWQLAAYFACLLLVTEFQAAAPPTPSLARINRLISQLGSDRFAEREAATQALARMGPLAVPALRRAADSPDLEIRWRAGRLVQQFDDRNSGVLLKFGDGNREVYCLAFSADGKRLLSGSWDNRIHLWDAATGKELWHGAGHTGLLRGVAFSADGRRALSASLDQTVRVWNLVGGKETHRLKAHTDNAMSACFSPDGKTVATGGNDEKIRLWDAATGKERLCITDRDRAWVVVFTPDGKHLLSVGGYKNDYSIRLRDAGTGKEVRRLTGHTREVSNVAVSADGRTVLSSSWDGTVRHWDLATGKELRCLKGHHGEVQGVALSADGKRGASGGADGIVRVWDLATGKAMREFKGHAGTVNAVVFSPDGRRLASGSSDQTIRLWEVPQE